MKLVFLLAVIAYCNGQETIKSQGVAPSSNSLGSMKIVQGMWHFNSMSINGYPVYPVQGSFGNTFQRPPAMIYSLKLVHIANNVAPLYQIYDEKITNTQIQASVKFFGGFQIHQFWIQWTAIGY